MLQNSSRDFSSCIAELPDRFIERGRPLIDRPFGPCRDLLARGKCAHEDEGKADCLIAQRCPVHFNRIEQSRPTVFRTEGCASVTSDAKVCSFACPSICRPAIILRCLVSSS